jgi:hypothetical protein
VANAHITKARRVCWAVSMKISSGCCKQELGDFLHFTEQVPEWNPQPGIHRSCLEPYCRLRALLQ